MCVQALQGDGPTLTPHIMQQQEEEVGFWVDWGPPGSTCSLQGLPGPCGLGRDRAERALRMFRAVTVGEGHVAHCRRTACRARSTSLC